MIRAAYPSPAARALGEFLEWATENAAAIVATEGPRPDSPTIRTTPTPPRTPARPGRLAGTTTHRKA